MEVGLLGPFTVRVGGRPLDLSAPRERALVAALALQAGRVVSVVALIDTLWGDSPPASATKTLQTYVAHVRRALTASGARGPDVLATEAPGYAIRVDPVAVDALAFQALVASARQALDAGDAQRASGDADAALRLWRGSPLEEFEFSERLQGERRLLEQQQVDALECRAGALVALGRHSEALADLHRLVGEHPLRERVWEYLIRALCASGRQADALASYQACRKTLAEELGINPGPSLQALERQVLMQDPSLSPPAPRHQERRLPPALRARARGQMFGRESELEQVMTLWQRGEGGVVLVSGEAGIGKTQLVAALAARLIPEAEVLYGRSDESSGIPLQPFVEALDSLVRRLVAEASGGPLPDLLNRLGHVLPSAPTRAGATPTERQFVFDAMARLLTDAAPVVLVLDDMHWADTASVLLLQHLARTCDDGVLIVPTFRDTDVSGTALGDSLAVLAREPTVERIHLGPLGEDDGAAIVDLYVRDAGPEVRSALLAEADGNPLFIHETARYRAAQHEAGTVGSTGPDNVRDFVRWRLRRLRPETARAVEAAAVLGVVFRPRLALRAADLEDSSIVLDEAAATGLVRPVEAAAGEWAFSHAVIRRTVYSLIGAERRSSLHLKAAEALVDAGSHAAEAAHHLERAGDRADHDLLRRLWACAAEEALQATAYETAVDYASRVAACAASPRESCDARIVLAQALWRLGQFKESRRHAVEAAERARELRDGDAFARAALIALGDFPGFDWGSGHPDVIPLLRHSMTRLPATTLSLSARVAGGLASMQRVATSDAPSIAERRALAARAIELAQRSGDDATTAWVYLAARWGCATLSNVRERLALAEKAVALAERAGEVGLAVEANIWCFQDLLETGDVAAARARMDRVHTLAADVSESYVAWAAIETRATLALLDGDLDAAERLSAEAMAVNRPGENKAAMHAFGGQQMLISWARGRRRLEEVAPFALGLIDDIGGGMFGWRAAKALLLAARGDVEEARPLYEALVEEAATVDDEDITRLLGVFVLAEMATAFADARGAARLYDVVAPYADVWPTLGGGVTAGSMSRTLGQLALVFGDSGRAVVHLQHAVDVHEETPLFRAWAEVLLARALLARGGEDGRRRASSHLRSAEEGAARMGASEITRQVDEVRQEHRL